MKIEKKTTYTITTQIISIEEYNTLENCRIIIVKTSDGNFSNYKSVLDKQNLDIDTMTDGELLEITYIIHTAKNGAQFKNFLKIRRLERV